MPQLSVVNTDTFGLESVEQVLVSYVSFKNHPESDSPSSQYL